jgi:hypothetical protein
LDLPVIVVCDAPLIAVFGTLVIAVFETQVFDTRVMAFNDCPYPICRRVMDLLASSVWPEDFDVASLLVSQAEMDYSATCAVYAASSKNSPVLLVSSGGQDDLGSDRI